MKTKILLYSLSITLLFIFGAFGRGLWHPVYAKTVGQRTVSDIENRYGEQSRARIASNFKQAGIQYPPQKITFLASKDTDLLEVWASNGTQWAPIKTYDIKAASGKLGPKLREGDRQVPEGIYKIIGLNPNSAYHLSMKINYPNKFDLKWASKENRTEPGSNIFIHGNAVSIGCLAMGNSAIEELFIVSNDVGIKNINVIIAPSDPRIKALVPPKGSKPWVHELYQNIEEAFKPYQKTSASSANTPS